MVLNSINKADIYIRNILYNTVLTGGNTLLKGMEEKYKANYGKTCA